MTQHNLSSLLPPQTPRKKWGSSPLGVENRPQPSEGNPNDGHDDQELDQGEALLILFEAARHVPPKRKRPRRRGGAFCGSSFQSHFRRLARVGDADGRPERASELCRVAKIVGSWYRADSPRPYAN